MFIILIYLLFCWKFIWNIDFTEKKINDNLFPLFWAIFEFEKLRLCSFNGIFSIFQSCFVVIRAHNSQALFNRSRFRRVFCLDDVFVSKSVWALYISLFYAFLVLISWVVVLCFRNQITHLFLWEFFSWVFVVISERFI